MSNFDPLAFGIANEKLFKNGTADEATVAELVGKLQKILEGYERILSKSKFLAGDKITLADIFHVPYASLLEALGYGNLFSEFPAFKAWLKGLQSREPWKKINTYELGSLNNGQ